MISLKSIPPRRAAAAVLAATSLAESAAANVASGTTQAEAFGVGLGVTTCTEAAKLLGDAPVSTISPEYTGSRSAVMSTPSGHLPGATFLRFSCFAKADAVVEVYILDVHDDKAGMPSAHTDYLSLARHYGAPRFNRGFEARFAAANDSYVERLVVPEKKLHEIVFKSKHVADLVTAYDAGQATK